MRRRQVSDVAALLGCQSLLLLTAVWPLLGGWVLMLGMGVVHHEWPAVPSFGYWPCVALAALLSLARLPAAVAKIVAEALKS